LFALFAMTDAQKRGKALESILNRLFANYGIAVREAFTVAGPDGEGVVEQIDGAVELDGHLYLVEMKWWDKPLGRAEVSPHLVRVFSRAAAGGDHRIGVRLHRTGHHDVPRGAAQSGLHSRGT
jgi:hypothetical protein